MHNLNLGIKRTRSAYRPAIRIMSSSSSCSAEMPAAAAATAAPHAPATSPASATAGIPAGSSVTSSATALAGHAASPPQLPPPGIRAVVWDFDRTILKVHSFALRLTAADVATRDMAADFTDLPFFQALVSALQEAGVLCLIASFGKYEVIQAYMDRILPEHTMTRDTICTPSQLNMPRIKDGYSVPGGKIPQLQLLCKQHGLDPDSIMFFDGMWLHRCRGSLWLRSLRHAARSLARLQRQSPTDDCRNIEGPIGAEALYPHSFWCPDGFSSELWDSALEEMTR